MNELIDYIKKKNINQIFNYLNSNKNINLLNEKNENAFNLCIQNKIPNVCYFLLQNDRLNLEVIDSDKNSYLFLDLNSAFSNDLSLFWGCTLVKEANIENQLKAVNPNISKKNINIIKNGLNGNNLKNVVEEVINGNITVIEDPLKNKNN